jgi:hypothetical protein
MKARAEEGDFKGNPTITIFTGHEYQGKEEQITMGIRKARAVDDCIDAIRQFVDKHGKGAKR